MRHLLACLLLVPGSFLWGATACLFWHSVAVTIQVVYRRASVTLRLTPDSAGCVASLLYGATALLFGSWPFTLGFLILAAYFASRWWRRRKRKRSPRALGAKSKAQLAALVRKTREAGRPGPVLRPVPA